MTKSTSRKRACETARALVSFIELSKSQQDDFIASMNEFLLASPKVRRQMIHELRGSCAAEKCMAGIENLTPADR